MNDFYVDLGDMDVLTVSGSDAARFLQGQLSCDVLALNTSHSSLGTLCNTKGRIIAAFRIAKDQDNYYLQLPAGMGTGVHAHLSRFSVFFKTELSLSGSSQLRRFGLTGALASEWIGTKLTSPAPGETLRLDGLGLLTRSQGEEAPQYELWLLPSGNTERQEQIIADMKQQLSQGNETDWLRSMIRNGTYLPNQAQSERFTPEELNLDVSDAVSFTKGCYTGQEVVARMHYRGKGKKRLHYFRSLDNETCTETPVDCSLSSASLQTTQEDGSKQDCGEIIYLLVKPGAPVEGLFISKQDIPTTEASLLLKDTTRITVSIHRFLPEKENT